MTFAFLQQATSTADSSSYTFASQNLGAADAARYIIVGIQCRRTLNTNTISSVTVGGVTASLVVTADRGNQSKCAIYIAAVPTGTTGDVVVTFSGTANRCGIALWSAVGISSATASDTDSSITGTAPTMSIDVPAGGFAVAVGCENALTTATWTGLTERSDTQAEITMTSASDEFASAQTGLSVTITFASTVADEIGVIASWAPAASTKKPPIWHLIGGVT